MKWLLLCLFTFAGVTHAAAQTSTPAAEETSDEVLRVSTNLVTVPVLVKSHNSYVTNLRPENFRIFEDNVEQQISHFETVDKPFTVALMLDVSDSTRTELASIQNAAGEFLNALKPADRVIVIAFDKQMVKFWEATSDRVKLADAIRRVKSGASTALYEALVFALTNEMKRIPGRKAIVVLTDGIDTSSVSATYESSLRAASEQCVVIYPIQWDTPNDYLAKQLSPTINDATGGVMYTTPSGEPLRKAYERGTRYLQLIAEASGGRFQYADNLKNLNRSFARIAEELRQQYTLSYYPRNRAGKNGKRRITVKVNVQDAVVHARDSYAYKSGAQ